MPPEFGRHRGQCVLQGRDEVFGFGRDKKQAEGCLPSRNEVVQLSGEMVDRATLIAGHHGDCLEDEKIDMEL